MASAGARTYNGIWRRSPQRGPGANPLVRRSGAKPPEAEKLLVFYPKGEPTFSHFSGISWIFLTDPVEVTDPFSIIYPWHRGECMGRRFTIKTVKPVSLDDKIISIHDSFKVNNYTVVTLWTFMHTFIFIKLVNLTELLWAWLFNNNLYMLKTNPSESNQNLVH